MIFRYAKPPGGRRGFTLVEMLVVLAILALLLTFGLPAFLKYSLQGRLTIARSALKQIAEHESRWFVEHRVYASLEQLSYPVDSSLAAIYLGKDGSISGSASRDSIYRITLGLGVALPGSTRSMGSGAASAYYLIAAQPINEQAKETSCGTLSLASTGQVGASGSGGEAACWQE